MKRIIPVVLVALLLGCTASLGPVAKLDDKDVSVRDQRQDAEKKSFRSGMTSPVILLGDENFDVNPMLYLQEALQRHKPPAAGSLQMVVRKFRLIDYFPKRQASAQQAALVGVMTSMGYSVTSVSSARKDEDSIICVLEGSLNGRAVQASVSTPYKLNSAAAAVRSDANWIAAARKSIDQCVAAAVSQAVP
ncbi:MAG TPA: hypothetical protein VI319_01820 [Burkholderiales bacterium]